MKAEQLEVGKVYKTFSYETARAIVQEEVSRPMPDNIYGISKETWDDDLSLVKVVSIGITSSHVRSVHGDSEFIWSIPCCAIREEAQF